MKYIFSHDVGTSGDKAVLFSEDGKLIGSEVYPYDADYFNANWAEQDSENWWKAVCHTSKALIKSSAIDPKDIAAISFSGQMMGCLCVDREGVPLRKSIIWADMRSLKQAEQLAEHISPKDFYHITGHRNNASYGVQKLMWVMQNQPEIYDRTYKVLNAKDYLVFKLTGKFCTDYSEAAGMACLNINKLDWSEEIVEYAGIDPEKLPELRESTYVAGGVTKEAAAQTGFCEGTPVVLGAGDGMAACVGAGSYKPGRTYSYIGSSAWIATTSEKPLLDPEMRFVTWVHSVPGMYSPNGTMQCAGGSYQWLRDTICKYETIEAKKLGVSPYKLIDEELEKSAAGAGGITFLPHLLGERAPRWNPDAKGAFIGIKMENSRADMLRSVLEGVTFNLSIILDCFRSHMPIDEFLVIGGGAKGAVWRQMMADIYNARVKTPVLLEEATSMGAAIIGGVGVGLFKGFETADDFIEIASVHEPNSENTAVYAEAAKRYDELYHALEKHF